MSWRLEYTSRAVKQLRKLDRQASEAIRSWMKEHIDGCENPRAYGKALTGTLSHLWRYRVGDYRVLCTFDGEELIVLAVEVEHRSKVYQHRKDGRRK